MKYIKIVFFFMITLSCEKDHECFSILIVDKKIINNKYYFFFNKDTSEDFQNTFDEVNYVPDQNGSGEVDLKTYQSYEIGEVYCN